MCIATKINIAESVPFKISNLPEHYLQSIANYFLSNGQIQTPSHPNLKT